MTSAEGHSPIFSEENGVLPILGHLGETLDGLRVTIDTFNIGV